jgi:hypothetical protein
MGLEPATLRRLAACFAGHVCCRCGRPAERLWHQRFYCARHLARARPGEAEVALRVYHCWLGVGAGR